LGTTQSHRFLSKTEKMNSKAQERVAVLASHLASNGPSEAQPCDTQQAAVKLKHTAASRGSPMLADQVAIITGSGQGVGAAAAKLFAEHGARVAVTDIDKEKSDKVAKEIKDAGGQAISVPGDVTKEDFPERIMKATIDAFGRLDILINNAGYTWDGVIHRITPKQWEAMLAVHQTAPFRLIQAAAPHMRDAAKQEMQQEGHARPRCIINVSSTSGTHGNAGQANYATAKAGVIGLTKTVAKEWGQFNIRCNGIAYGYIETRLTADKGNATMTVDGQTVKLGIPGATQHSAAARKLMIPLQRTGTPQEAAGAMLMLASPYSSYITAQMIEVTGGTFA
jgi:3-oxoacyl-[acyl-carrier protein] reductase